MVYIVTDRSICGGVILNQNTILSAAHCLKDISDIKLYVGFVSRANLPSPTEVYEIIIHPKYNDITMENDLAIIKIKPLVFTSKIQPIAILNQELPEGTRLTVKGWGLQRNGQLAIEMRDIHVEMKSPESCIKKYGNDFKNLLQICAGDDFTDFCIGDSGGPLVYKDSKLGSKEYLVGIVSYTGQFCADGRPSVYSRIYYYLNWIKAYLQ